MALEVASSMSEEVERILEMPYVRELVRDEEGTWFARIVEFPGCKIEGDTPKEAFAELDAAARKWVAAALKAGRKIPEPIAQREWSGKLVIRVSPALHRDVARRAEAEGVTFNAFVSTVLARAVGEEQP